jgi:hypothetical protein
MGKLLVLKQFNDSTGHSEGSCRPESNCAVHKWTSVSSANRWASLDATPIGNCDKLEGCALPRGSVI